MPNANVRYGKAASDSKMMKISGFKNISYGDLPIINDYGIEAAMIIKPNKDLIYELYIPLSQLLVDIDLKKQLLYNIKINFPAKSTFIRDGDMVERPKSRGKGGMAGGGKIGGQSEGQRPYQGDSKNKSVDFWIKYKLIKA